MIELVNIFGGGIGAFLEAVVGKSIHDDVVVFLYKGFNDTETSEPSCRVDKQWVDTPKLSQLLLKLHVIPKIKNSKYLVAPKAKGLPAELTPKLVAASIAASLANSFLAKPR